MRNDVVYLDASAIIKLVFDEAETEAPGADPDDVAPGNAAVAQSTFGCHHALPFRGRALLERHRIRPPETVLKGGLHFNR